MKKVGVIIGSLRKESYARKWANNIIDLYPSNYDVKIIEIGHLPFYNQDFDDYSQVPESIIEFRQKIGELDAAVFVTPEYNRSIPPALKNAIDIGSRPIEDSRWNGKPALIVSHSISRLSGFGANHHLRQVLTFVDMPMVKQPEVYLADSSKELDDQGNIKKESRIELLQSAVDAHVKLIKMFRN